MALGCGDSVRAPFSDASPSPVRDGSGPDSTADGVSDDSGAIDQEPPPAEGGSATCRTDIDCQQPSQQFCVPCFEGGVSCATSRCIDDSCEGLAPQCSGPLTDPCAYKACGDPCQQCSTSDGGCYPGVCTWFGQCKAATNPVCDVTATLGCGPTDAIGLGDCNIFLGWGWDGSKCIAVVGCLCQGSDCVSLVGAEMSDCLGAYSGCRDGG